MPGSTEVGSRALIQLFIKEALEDTKSPTTSTFANKIPLFRDNVKTLAERSEADLEALSGLRRSVRHLAEAQRNTALWQGHLAADLEKLAGLHQGAEAPLLASGLSRMSVVFRQLNDLVLGLAQTLDNALVFPLDRVKSGEEELKEGAKTALNKISLYQARLAKIAKSRPRDSGWSGSLSPADLATDMMEERAAVQASLAKFYLSYNRQTARKGTELVQNLVVYFHTLQTMYVDGQRSAEECAGGVGELGRSIASVHDSEDAERSRLHEVEASVEESGSRPESPEPPFLVSRPSTSDQVTIAGTLWKKGRLGGWQKREGCRVAGARLFIPHSDANQPPLSVSLTQCGVALSRDDPKVILLQARASPKGGRREFQAEDEAAARKWVLVMKNAQAQAFAEPEGSNGSGDGNLISILRSQTGNGLCADCSTDQDVSWISTNLGLLLCIACAGIHRDLGVQVSRTQSLSLDAVSGRELLPALAVGNTRLNAWLASRRPSQNLQPKAPTSERKEYIRDKYLNLAFALEKPEPARLAQLVRESDAAGLVACLLSHPLPKDAKSLLSEAVKADVNIAGLGVLELLLIHGADIGDSNQDILDSVIRSRKRLFLRLLVGKASVEGRNKTAQLAKELGYEELVTLAESPEPPSHSDLAALLGVKKETGLGSSCSSLISSEESAARRTGSLGSARGPPTPPPAWVKPVLPPSSLTRPERTGSLNHTVGTNGASHRRSLSESLQRPMEGRPPLPKPRILNMGGRSGKRARALFDCHADNEDELSFRKGELIAVTRERLSGEDPAWMEGFIVSDPVRKGIFPTSFVTFEAL